MSVRRNILCAVVAAMSATPVMAGTATGKISSLRTRATDGLQIVTIQGPFSGRPSCATYDYFMIRDEKSEAGKAQFAMLMAAFLSGRTVTIDGAGSCQRWFDGEDISTVSYVQ